MQAHLPLRVGQAIYSNGGNGNIGGHVVFESQGAIARQSVRAALRASPDLDNAEQGTNPGRKHKNRAARLVRALIRGLTCLASFNAT